MRGLCRVAPRLLFIGTSDYVVIRDSLTLSLSSLDLSSGAESKDVGLLLVTPELAVTREPSGLLIVSELDLPLYECGSSRCTDGRIELW